MCKFKHKESRVTKNQVTITKGTNKEPIAQPKSTSALLTVPKPFTVWITINCGKF